MLSFFCKFLLTPTNLFYKMTNMKSLQNLIKDVALLASRLGNREILILIKKHMRSLNSYDPDFAKEVSRAIASGGGVGSLRRFNGIDQIPVDADSGMELLVTETSPMIEASPILGPEANLIVQRFLRERQHLDELRAAGLRLPTSLALMGPPGTGKTTLARWLAKELSLPLFILNLASVVTSYLGQTGQNLKKALDRARLEPSLLLIDEFDALGRSRMENEDVVEMKRVVTVLLQEIEAWPEHSVVIAATNLPELVDTAFRRRFSRWVKLDYPNRAERFEILQLHYKGKSLPKEHLRLAAICLEMASGADIESFANRVAARQILDNVRPLESLLEELEVEIKERSLSKDIKRQFVQISRETCSKVYTYRKLSKLLDISHSTARNFINKEKPHAGGTNG